MYILVIALLGLAGAVLGFWVACKWYELLEGDWDER
jgi:hypothetical protein